MSEDNKTYEGMFLIDAGNPNFAEASEPVKSILERRVEEILSFKPWDERKLAYTIKGRKRGLYVLSYFRAEGDAIAELERDCRLDERIVRALFLRKDKLDEETINAETPATSAARRSEESDAAQAASGEGAEAKPAEEPKPAEQAPPAEEPKSAEQAPPAEEPKPAEAPAPAPAENAEQAPAEGAGESETNQ